MSTEPLVESVAAQVWDWFVLHKPLFMRHAAAFGYDDAYDWLMGQARKSLLVDKGDTALAERVAQLEACPECGFPYRRLQDLEPHEVRNLLFADMYDCETCNTVLPAWARQQIVGHVDREPQPTDGPEYHADHVAWVERQRRRNDGSQEGRTQYADDVRACVVEVGHPRGTPAEWIDETGSGGLAVCDRHRRQYDESDLGPFTWTRIDGCQEEGS